MHNASEIITFWFDDHGPKDWWNTNPDFDQEIIDRFSNLHHAATKGELFGWRNTPEGRLAEIIVLDQFSRQIYRNKAEAFACDIQALTLAQEAVHHGLDRALHVSQRAFLYMPYMHSESLVIHQQSMDLFTKLGSEDNRKAAQQHFEVLQRFGRYPTRNKALGRQDTAEEATYLAERTGGAV